MRETLGDDDNVDGKLDRGLSVPRFQVVRKA